MRDAAIDTHRSTARGAGRARSAGAPRLDDMAGEGPVGRGAPRRGDITSAAIAAQRLGGGRAADRGKRTPGLAARLRDRLPRVRPLKALTVAAFGVALVGIVANAMVFQRGHHPSPLFGLGHPVDGSPDAGAQAASAMPAPAPQVPVERTGTIPAAPVAAAPAAAASPAAALPKPVALHHAPAKAHRDPVAAEKATDKPAPSEPHPRPGRPAAQGKAEPKSDPLAKLLAGSPGPGKAEAKPAAPHKTASKPDVKPASGNMAHAPADVAPAPAPHHRVATAKPAAEAE